VLNPKKENNTSKFLKAFNKLFEKKNCEVGPNSVYLIGGFVRDTLLNLEANDVDIVTTS
jgi:tRNA nucleotidyltransferase/poly(A) polymerase